MWIQVLTIMKSLVFMGGHDVDTTDIDLNQQVANTNQVVQTHSEQSVTKLEVLPYSSEWSSSSIAEPISMTPYKGIAEQAQQNDALSNNDELDSKNDRPVMALNEKPAIKSHSIPNNSRPTRSSYKSFPSSNHELSQLPSMEVVATGYYAGRESTGKGPKHPEYGITFSGLKVVRDERGLSTIAADPRVFPLGTVLYVPGYGYGVVADTGSAIKGNKIDLYYDTKSQVFSEWGKKNVRVFIVKQGTGSLSKQAFNDLAVEMFTPSNLVNGKPS
ncbi:3D domain-containing protein [Paenibacillus sp. KN14-4R]|uniref:3D domain-containing protein n=1 Tax=Paenibacillus sp. KN14-4R TaxID=3445773 RepID=UPI003FA161FC